MIFLTPSDALQAAFDRAPAGSEIRLAEGVYREKLMIRTPGLRIIGAGADKTRLVYGDAALDRDEAGRDLVTFRTWTLAVCAPGVSLADLTVENDAGNPSVRGQQVALSVAADGCRLERVSLLSTQDTLFWGPLPRDLQRRYSRFLAPELLSPGPCTGYVKDSLIAGTVDFVFGCGEVLFEGCEIRSRAAGYVAAPSHEAEQLRGFVFSECRLTAEEGVPQGSVFLARPWRDAGFCLFADCVMGPHIAAAGFDPWLDSGRDRTARFFETPVLPEGRVPWCRRMGTDNTLKLIDSLRPQ